MKIGIGSDHGGVNHKAAIIKHLSDKGIEVIDYGTQPEVPADYPDVAETVCKGYLKGAFDLGILVCGTGIGMSIAANKVKGIRCALCSEPYSAKLTRQHNNANMLAIGARVIGPELAKMIVRTFLTTEFEGGRHQRRIDLITALEEGQEIE